MKDSLLQMHDRFFKLMISSDEIMRQVERAAKKINDLHIQNPLFVAVLNGSFMFASDLCKNISLQPYVNFIKVTSYKGMQSTENVSHVIGIDVEVHNKTIFIIEDIIDTGTTIEFLYNKFMQMGAANVYVVTLLFKPLAYKATVPIFYKGIEIPNDFVIGYGMDYNGLGRDLKDIYVLDN